MKLNLQFASGVSFLAIVSMILLISSPAVAVPTTPSLTTNTYSTTPNVELGHVVAGIGLATYSQIFTFGGVDGSTIPVDTTVTAFAEAQTWYVASINQADFASYLQRSPSPVSAPDGLSFHVKYSATTSANTATSRALDAASALSTVYGVTLDLTSVDLVSKSYTFWANGSDTTTIESAVATDVTDLGSNGLSTLLDANTITSAPVFWSGYGARLLAGSQVVQFGAGWVDTDGLLDDGNGVYRLSSDNIFGGPMTPTSVSTGLSRVTFKTPYPIEPITNGISPETSNPLPHVTGTAQWDLNHPISEYSLGAQSDLSLAFKVKQDESFPNIQTTFSIDQAQLASGTLEGTFKLKNIGTETANDIEMVYNLGPGFGLIANQQTSIYEIDKTTYDLDTTHSAEISISSAGLGISEKILDFTGWYNLTSNGALAEWDPTSTDMVIYTDTDTGYTVNLVRPNGLPTFLVTYITATLIPALEGVSPSNVNSVLNTELAKLVQAVKVNTLNTFYTEKQIFVFDETGDFTVKQRDYQSALDRRIKSWFMNSTVSSLAPGASTTLKFTIDNVPTVENSFQFFNFDYQEAAGTTSDLLPNATINSFEENWFNVMQYMFERKSYDGRPLSTGLPDSLSFGPDSLGLDDFHSEQYVSFGAYLKYKNDQNYPFFSFSNGQNLQIADDEAVISAAVSLDKQVYYPDETKTITVDLNNTGDLPAENVKVHLFHAALGRDWNLERTHRFATVDVGTLAAGSDTSVSYETESNSFIGYHPVFALVTFDSDVGQGSAPLTDFLDLGINEYQAAGETSHIVFSTLTGALLMPQPGATPLNPTLGEPNVEISKTTGDLDADNQFKVSYTLENTGDRPTEVFFGQHYATNDLELVDYTDLPNADEDTQTYPEYNFGYLYYNGIELGVGQSATVELTFELLSSGATIYPAFATFTTSGESSLGDTVNTGFSSIGETSLLGLSAGSDAQEDSQKSANENSASSSYSASSSVGASVNTGVDTNVDTREGLLGFIGYDALNFLALMAIPLTLVTFLKRRR